MYQRRFIKLFRLVLTISPSPPREEVVVVVMVVPFGVEFLLAVVLVDMVGCGGLVLELNLYLFATSFVLHPSLPHKIINVPSGLSGQGLQKPYKEIQ